jgi:hypothetical protein
MEDDRALIDEIEAFRAELRSWMAERQHRSREVSDLDLPTHDVDKLDHGQIRALIRDRYRTVRERNRVMELERRLALLEGESGGA